MSTQSRVSRSAASQVVRASATPLLTKIEVGGAIAGLVGGITMAVVGAILAIAMGADLWKAAKLISTFVLGLSATAGEGFVAVPVIVGSLIHLSLSALFGALYGALSCRIWKMPLDYGKMPLDYGAPVVFGFVYGLAIWLIAYFIVLPIVNPLLLEIYAPSFLIQNMVYGMILGMVYAAFRSAPYIHFEKRSSSQA